MADIQPIPSDPRFQNLTGRTFGRLTVESYAGVFRKWEHAWNCLCECGTRIRIRGWQLTGKKPSRSCGCLQRDTAATLGGATLGENRFVYDIWRQMIERCHNSDNAAFANYGGRGITVCERWRGEGGLANFIADMGQPLSRKHTLDRTDNGGNYEPSNCRWATRKEQNRNRRDNRMITFNGETLCLAEWAERLGLTTMALWLRLHRRVPLEKALTTPKAKRFT